MIAIIIRYYLHVRLASPPPQSVSELLGYLSLSLPEFASLVLKSARPSFHAKNQNSRGKAKNASRQPPS